MKHYTSDQRTESREEPIFTGTFPRLEKMVASTGHSGDWVSIKNGLQFRARGGAVLNWCKDGKLQFQGPITARRGFESRILQGLAQDIHLQRLRGTQHLNNNCEENDMEAKTMPRLMTTKEASEVLRLSPKTLYGWAANDTGPIKAIRIPSGSKYIVRWRATDVNRLIEEGNDG